MLCPLTFNYFKDLVSYCAIGARTSESQIHRSYLSSINIPCGIKNDMYGNIEVAIQGVVSVKQQHTFLNISQDGNIETINSKGNKSSRD